MNTQISDLVSKFRSFSVEQQTQFLAEILSTTHNHVHCLVDDSIASVRFKDGLFCPHCGDTNVVKRGFTANGNQRYLCKSCHHSFSDTTNTTLQYTKKELNIWLKYFDCMANHFSIRKSARLCEISVPTAFNWRHKILDSLRNRFYNKNEQLSGVVEADETFFHLSFKGSRNIETVAGRKAHKRGNSIKKRGLSKEQVCVPCAVSVRGNGLSQIGKLGSCNLSALSLTLGNRIKSGSILCSDRLNVYNEFCLRFHLEHNCSGLKHVAKLLDAQGGHIQHINGYHSSMKRFMRPFNGVATKYLNNYLVWYNNARDINYNEYSLRTKIRNEVYVEEIYVQRDFLSKRNQVPVVA